MQITPTMIKELRESTNAGLMDCKNALAQTNGDMKEAVLWLRKKGLSKAQKVSGKVAAEGLVSVKIQDSKALIVEVNSETDFVAKNENFVSFVQDLTDIIFDSGVNSVEELQTKSFSGKTYEDMIAEATAKVGEKIALRRFAFLEGLVGGYVHANGRVATIVSLNADANKDLVPTIKDIAMHATAMNPLYLQESDVPKEIIAKEEEVAKEQLKKEGKPENIWEKIIPGKVKRFYKETCLKDQPFVKDDKKSVEEALNEEAKKLGSKANITGFVRYEVGEGIEKKQDNFADEVAAQLGQK